MQTLLFVGLLAVCYSAIAQELPGGGAIQSAPFNLIVLSHSRSLNGSYLGACHEGAADESLCVSKATTPSQFQWNGTYWSCANATCNTNVTNVTIGIPGTLAYYFSISVNDTTLRMPQSMTLVNQGFSSNMAFATIAWRGDDFYNFVAFNDQGMMNLQDTLNPRDKGGSPYNRPKAYYQWYICDNYWGWYRYQHLMWRYGSGDPWDGTCEPAKVKRVFLNT